MIVLEKRYCRAFYERGKIKQREDASFHFQGCFVPLLISYQDKSEFSTSSARNSILA
jgi:hypothetical protein